MVLGFSDLKRGITIELEGQPYQVIEYQQVKMQQRAPVLRIKLRDLRTGRTVEKSFQGTVSLARAEVENRSAQYLYTDGEHYYFMDAETFDQFPLSAEKLGDSLHYLKEQALVELVFYKGEPISIEMPTYVDLAVAETPPGVKGDTAQGGTKPAKLETGITVQVPLFVNMGDKVRIDTRTGQYLERVG